VETFYNLMLGQQSIETMEE